MFWVVLNLSISYMSFNLSTSKLNRSFVTTSDLTGFFFLPLLVLCLAWMLEKSFKVSKSSLGRSLKSTFSFGGSGNPIPGFPSGDCLSFSSIKGLLNALSSEVPSVWGASSFSSTGLLKFARPPVEAKLLRFPNIKSAKTSFVRPLGPVNGFPAILFTYPGTAPSGLPNPVSGVSLLAC